MKLRIAINGFGRIGRNILRALYENEFNGQIEIVAINDLSKIESAAHLLKYDSIHGRFSVPVTTDQNNLVVATDNISYHSQPDPKLLPWADLKVDYVFECTGRFTTKQAAAQHIEAGARKVIVSAPTKEADATIVHGVNHQVLSADMQVISNASCTTNCLAPVAKVLNDAIGIEQGSMTTIHAVTNDQNLLDFDHKDIYRARSSTQSMIPTKTGAAGAVGLVLPELSGKLDGMSVRVPTLNVSLVDFNFLASKETTEEEVNSAIENACQDYIGKVLQYNTEPLVSIDFNHQPASSIFDATQTRVSGRWVKVMAWYDNEWGFSNRMLDNALALYATEKADVEFAA
ncbi:type I glyceraldehyde-3-phosphate dehydrogenase [Aliikangiella coralliicola]|uniref:Glyceraldehyde-3-phosphate dehydrogenase n=1 Tax=Aliikangiella coralliicola TaxID=2592383 RepID=A0A545UHH9_9GAMM|nr:type I glyceraldehyde-3-phosphate dehydrogenase [Aliikangiella coralliicola]TQV88931.1 type I glyceraldehyde-3-phosphate dehydrogenase [Aliikangiella coralliicola]